MRSKLHKMLKLLETGIKMELSRIFMILKKTYWSSILGELRKNKFFEVFQCHFMKTSFFFSHQISSNPINFFFTKTSTFCRWIFIGFLSVLNFFFLIEFIYFIHIKNTNKRKKL